MCNNFQVVQLYSMGFFNLVQIMVLIFGNEYNCTQIILMLLGELTAITYHLE